MKKLIFLLSMSMIVSLQTNCLEQQLKDLQQALLNLGQIISPAKPEKVIIEEEKIQQLINTLKDLDIEQESEFVTIQDWVESLKITLDKILLGFNKDGDYIGYPNYEGKFLEQHLGDYDTGVKLLRAASDNKHPKLIIYDDWRPYLEGAVGTLPKTNSPMVRHRNPR